MSKKKQKGLPYNNLTLIANTKEHFLRLCEMYAQMGLFFKQQSKVLKHPLFSNCSIHQIQERLLNQYHQIGEEMKTVGTYLDLMGGKSIMKAKEPERKTIGNKSYPPNLLNDAKNQDEVFVSNIKPSEKKDKNKKKKEEKEEKK
jgi:hypothetical protein